MLTEVIFVIIILKQRRVYMLTTTCFVDVAGSIRATTISRHDLHHFHRFWGFKD